MFADSLLDSAWAHDSRRGWTTLISFAVQALVVTALLLLPLIYGEGIPALQWAVRIAAPTPPPGPPVPAQARNTPRPASNLSADHGLIMPTQIPDHTAMITDDVPPPPADAGPYVEGSVGSRGARDGVVNSILTAMTNVIAPPFRPTIARPLMISHMMEGNLVHKVQPDYPPLARQARIQGAVVLQAVISRDGTIENLQVLSGHLMLVPSALAAVKQWRYRPYFLNGEPVEVETQVTVNFVLGGG